MDKHEEGFALEMPTVGIIKGVKAKDIEVTGRRIVNMRTCARPYSNIYSVAQLRALKEITEEDGASNIHLSPRHNLEIPEVNKKSLNKVLKKLYTAGLFPGGAGTSVRNVFTCPEWCDKAVRPTHEIGKMISRNFGDKDMPNKVTVSFAGCRNACSRPHNTDMGIIAIGKVSVGEGACPDGCTACMDECRLDAIKISGSTISIDADKCNSCTFCVEPCPEDIINLDETGYEFLIGGREGRAVSFGQVYADFVHEFEVLEIIEKTLTKYQEKAGIRPLAIKKKERIAEVIERVGLDSFMGD